jgi:hypothetical protein
VSLQKYRADKPGEAYANGGVPWYAHWMGGPSLALVRNCRIENADIPSRTVYVRGEPDTWFSIPAACVYKRRTITGYLCADDAGEMVFRAHTDQGLPAREPAVQL